MKFKVPKSWGESGDDFNKFVRLANTLPNPLSLEELIVVFANVQGITLDPTVPVIANVIPVVDLSCDEEEK